MKQLSKKELQKQLNEIEEQELSEIIDIHYPEFKKLEGKFFKYKNNYSCPDSPKDYWFMYSKVIKITRDDIREGFGDNKAMSSCEVMSFQTDKDGKVFIDKCKATYTHLLGNEISKKIFDREWAKMINSITSLH